MVFTTRIMIPLNRIIPSFLARRRFAALTTAAVLASGTGLVATLATPARAAGDVAVTVSASPSPVATGQAMAYTINVANTGAAAASGLTLTDTLSSLVAVAPQSAPFFTTSAGSCGYDGTQPGDLHRRQPPGRGGSGRSRLPGNDRRPRARWFPTPRR